MTGKHKLLGEILLNRAAITGEQLESALRDKDHGRERLGECLVRMGVLSWDLLTDCLAEQIGVPRADLSERLADPALLSRCPKDFLEKQVVVPLGIEEGELWIAISDPLDVHTVDDLQMLLQHPARICLASEEEIRDCLHRSYEQEDSLDRVVSDMSESDLELVVEVEEEVSNLQEMANEAPIIRLVNAIIAQAVKERATDIHIESYEREVLVRYRVDGLLYDVNRLPKRLQAPIISRVKIMSDLNIAERRLPQDGGIKLRASDREIDMRVSTVPTMFGESVVMRILDRCLIMLSLEEIGFPKRVYQQWLDLITMPHGIILVTGPTGSGKTTTLYGSLNKIKSEEQKIITVEDPIEYQLDGINQIQVNPKIGLTFSNALRSLLRQDPDIMMVGEIRDRETADIAVQSALTGHLVLSTLHTNDAPGAVTRLLDMNIENFLVASSVIGVMAQRLVRKICVQCKTSMDTPIETLATLGIATADAPKSVFQGVGCDECNHGYFGRTGIYELLVMNEQLRNLILENPSADVIRRAAVDSGMLTLAMDGWLKVKNGVTSLEELLRIARSTIAMEE